MSKIAQSVQGNAGSTGRHDAIEMLIADHKAVKRLFAEFDALRDHDHAKAEERDMFPHAKKARVDTLALGALMATRQAQLVAARQQGASKVPNPRRIDGAVVATR